MAKEAKTQFIVSETTTTTKRMAVEADDSDAALAAYKKGDGTPMGHDENTRVSVQPRPPQPQRPNALAAPAQK